jgi:hypothetical protein
MAHATAFAGVPVCVTLMNFARVGALSDITVVGV